MNEENEELKDFINNEADEELEMTAIDRYLQAGSLQQPSANFTQRVMNNLQPASTVTRSLPSRNKILMLAGILMTIGVAVLLIAGGAFNTVTSITIDQTIIPNDQLREYIPSVPFNGKLVINVAILMNLALAFMILDRAVLKPWFERRRHA